MNIGHNRSQGMLIEHQTLHITRDVNEHYDATYNKICKLALDIWDVNDAIHRHNRSQMKLDMAYH